MCGTSGRTPRLRASSPVVELTTSILRWSPLLDSLAASQIQASADQRARRLDSIKGAAATELPAPCLLAPGHLAVRIGCRAYARTRRRTSRQQCAEDYCCKQSAFCFHHGIPFDVKNAIGTRVSGSVRDHSDFHELPSFRLRSAGSRPGLTRESSARAPRKRHVAESHGRGDPAFAPWSGGRCSLSNLGAFDRTCRASVPR